MPPEYEKQREYIQSLDLSGLLRGIVPMNAAAPRNEVHDPTRSARSWFREDPILSSDDRKLVTYGR